MYTCPQDKIQFRSFGPLERCDKSDPTSLFLFLAASGNVDLRRLTLVSGDGTLVQIEEKKPSNVTPAASSADAGGGQEPPQQASYLDCVSGDVILGHANPAVTAVYASAVAQPGDKCRFCSKTT